ncbi:MAG TPA: preprotein translocase subunit SecE [Acidimicrobiales bacterium]|nr:preprotein translocase subunit SecE [Acidimicrobiales bacterium]
MSINDNREQDLLAQGSLDADGVPSVVPTSPRVPVGPPTGGTGATAIAGSGGGASKGGFHPRQFLDEVFLELRKVMKPKRAELVNYASVVFFTLVLLMALVYGLDYVYSLGASHLFK